MRARVREPGGDLCSPADELGTRARGAAPARGAGPADGRRGARRAPARHGPAHGARAHRRGSSTTAPSTRPGRSPAAPSTATTASSRTSRRRTWSWAPRASTDAGWSSRATTSRCAAVPPTRRSGRRRSGGEARPRATHAARAPRGRHRRRRQREVAGEMGFTYVPFVPGWELVVENLSAVPVVAAALGPVRRPGRRARRGLALQRHRPRDRAAVRRRPAGRGGRDGRDARQGGARRRTTSDARRAPSTTRRSTRTTRSRSCGGSCPTCPPTSGRRRR